MPEMLENAMARNTPDAPWNREDMPDWECSCGIDYGYAVRKEGYPSWRQNGRRFVEDCSVEGCERRCCHDSDCSKTCRICGRHFCPDHQKGFFEHLELCEDCGGQYESFRNYMEPPDLQKLIDIERKRKLPAGSYGHALLDSEIDWLVSSLKDAYESLATIPRARS